MFRRVKEDLKIVLQANHSKGWLRKAVVLKTDKVMNARLQVEENSTHLHLRRFNLSPNGFFYFQNLFGSGNNVHCKVRSGCMPDSVSATSGKPGLRKAVVLKTDKVMNARLQQRIFNPLTLKAF